MSADRITLTMAQACTATGLSDSFLRKAVLKGELPAKRAGSRYLIRRTDLDAWIDALEDVAS